MSRVEEASVAVAALPLAPAARFRLLEGIRVLDLTSSIAGPYATMLLGDMGADVVKVERPETGDDARSWGPPFLAGTSLWFLSVNRNKRSVALNYSTSAGLETLHGLAVTADVVVSNLRPAILEKIGLDYASVKKRRGDVVYCSITGFGMTGERRDQPSYDLIAEGYSGIMDLTGEPDGEPQKIGAPAADLLAGMDAAMSIIAALFDRQRTGEGHVIDIALLDSTVRFVAPRIVPYLGSGEVYRRSGGRDSPIAIYETFKTADEPLTLGLGNDAIFRRFCVAIGRPDWADDPAYSDNAARRTRRKELVVMIQKEMVGRSRKELLELFREARVPAGPVNRIDEVTCDPDLLRRGLFYQLQMGDDAVPQVGTAWLLDGEANGSAKPPPRLGEHTECVLGEWLGADARQIAALREAGAL